MKIPIVTLFLLPGLIIVSYIGYLMNDFFLIIAAFIGVLFYAIPEFYVIIKGDKPIPGNAPR